MLTEKEIDDYHESLSQHFIYPRKSHVIHINNTIGIIPALCTAPGGRIIGLAKHFNTVESFSDHTKEVRGSLYAKNQDTISISYEKV